MIISGKIQCLCFRGDSLAGIILKTSAFVIDGFNALLCAQDRSILQLCAVQTIAAGPIYLFTKQHDYASGMILQLLYRNRHGISTPILYFSQNYDPKGNKAGKKYPFFRGYDITQEKTKGCLN